MRKILLLWPFMLAYIYASSLVEAYRSGGIDSLEFQIEEILQNPTYWKEYLQNKDTSKGFYEFDIPIVFVDKKAKKMRLFHNVSGKQKEKSSQDVIVGKKGDKQKQGDLKTPVGVYEITRRFVPKDGFYGPISFELSYPNVMDKLNRKNGDGIWIHGFPLNNEKRDGRTKGCVALKNDLITKFDQDLGVDKAIVIISEAGDKVVKKDEIAQILANIYRWRYAWKISDIDMYLSFYSDDFRRFDGKNKREFSSMKRQIFNRQDKKIIRFTNIAISPYPNMKDENMYRIVFDEYYKAKNYNFKGKKELYVRFEDNQMKIIAER